MNSLKVILFRNLALILGVFLVSSSVSEWFHHKALLKYYEKVETEKAKTLASNLEATVLFESKSDFDNLLKSTTSQSVLLFDKDHNLIFSKGEIFNHKPYTKPSTWDEDYFISKAKIINNEELLGYLYIKTSTKNIFELATTNTIYLILTFITLTIIFILISKKIDAQIVKPIKSLNELIKKIISKDDLNIRVPLETPSIEIEGLSLSFNSLLQNLEQNKRRLVDLNLNLENKVEEKTKKLKHAITDLKKTQDQVIAQEKLASLGSLTAGVAHEIKNPINLINNSALIIDEIISGIIKTNEEKLSKGILSEEEARSLKNELKRLPPISNIIVKNGKRTDNIITSMLLLSRSQKAELETVSITQLLKLSLNFSFHAMRAKPDAISVIIKENLDDEALTKCFTQDLERAFVNIFDNSFYAMKIKSNNIKSDYKAELQVSVFPEGNNLKICIRDNGIGIKESVLNKMLEPFYTTKPAGSGTGLGMSMVNDIITAHKGELKIHSSENEFAETIIFLPIIL